MKIIVRILFGIDTSVGVFIYVFLSLVYGADFDPVILLFSIFCSHLPDIDFIPYLALKKKMGLVSHWVFCHHPVIVIPLVATTGYLSSLWHGSDRYIMFIAISGTALHFISDSWNTVGLHWLSPFSWRRYSLEGRVHRVDDETVKRFYAALNIDSVSDEFEVRLKKLNTLSIALFIGAVANLLFFVF